MQTYIKNTTNYSKSAYREIFDAESGKDRLEIFVKSKLKVYKVVAAGCVKIDREEFCAAKLSFKVLKDATISFNQGDAVSVKYDGEGVFFGYVFTKKRDKSNIIEVICYDQLRYLKNRRTYTRGRMRLDEVVNSILKNCALRAGQVDKGNAMLMSVAAENVSLLDVIKKACKDERGMSGERFMLFDNIGRIDLKNEKDMVLDIILDQSNTENCVYRDTIDEGVYNTIEVYSHKERLNTRTLSIVNDKETMDKWGTLILTKKAVDPLNAAGEAKNLLEEYNRINREIVFENAVGDIRIYPGSGVYVKMTTGDLRLEGYMRVKRAVHIFEKNVYSVNVYLDGSEIE